MATVYVAEYLKRQRKVAVKVLRPALVEQARTGYVQPIWLAIAAVGCPRMDEALLPSYATLRSQNQADGRSGVRAGLERHGRGAMIAGCV